MEGPEDLGRPRRQLSLFDTTAIIVGIIIGSGLYESTPLIASNAENQTSLLLVWILGGLFALVGALCYAELATTYPAEGGDYVYLTRGFGRPMGFLFAWVQLWIVRPGAVGAMAYVFGKYATQLASLGEHSLLIYAVAALVALAAINILGVRLGKWTQNVLTSAKVLGLLTVVAVGLFFVPPVEAQPIAEVGGGGFTLAMILVLYTYGGWNEMSYVAAEVRDPEKNIVRALLLGSTTVAAIYVLVNLAFTHALGFQGVRDSKAVAADVARLALGEGGARAISLLICISALGAINGMIFTGARIYSALGKDHRLFARLGRWSPRFGTPVAAVCLETTVTILLVAAVGIINAGIASRSGFERLVTFTAPAFWLFLMLTGVSLLVLRTRDGQRPRPFRVPGYPVTPLIFCGAAAFMVYSSVTYAIAVRSHEAWWSIGMLVLGVVVSWVEARRTRPWT
jgi:APA family basic amino acid/polyamine antiporter